MSKALANSLISLRGNPQSLHWLFYMGFFNNPACHQFTFTSGIGGDDNFIHILALHKAAYGAKLLAGLGNYDQIHMFRQYWQGIHTPRFVFFAVMFWVGKGY